MLHTSSFDVVTTLAPLRRELGLTRVLRGTLRGAAAGALPGIVILLVNHLHPLGPLAVPAAVGLVLLGALIGTGIATRHWPSSLDAARTADRHFALHDRLTTALELRASQHPLAVLQRDDVARRLDGLALRQSRGTWLPRHDVGLTALAAALFAGLLLFGGAAARPHRAVAAVPDSQRIHQAATQRMPQLTARLNQSLTPAARQNPALRKLNLALTRLQRQLLHTANRATALRAISRTQQQLRHLATALHPINQKAVAQLNSSLRSYLSGQRRSTAAANRTSASATAQALNRLAQQLAHLSAAQRAALAQALARAANASSNPTLRAALHQAASSLAYNDPRTAAQSLQQAASSLSQSRSAQTAQSQFNAAINGLNSLKNQISGVNTPSPSNGAPSAGVAAGKNPGQGQGTGQGQRGGAGQGKGKGNGLGQGRGRERGQGQGQGQGRGQGRGSGQGSNTSTGLSNNQGKGGSGAHGAGGGRGGVGPKGKGRYVTVYVPVKQGKGQHIIETGPNGTPQHGPLVPYQQVIAQYAQTAHSALDQAPLPPSMQSYVRSYFSAISH